MSKVLAVGDIHQKEWIVDKIEKIASNYDFVVLTGDYVDNWGSSSLDRVTMFQRMMSFVANTPNVVALSGNHDLCYHDKRYMGMYSGWDYTAQLIITNDHPEITEWLRQLPQLHVIDEVTYSHAGCVDGWTEETSPMDEDGHMWVRPHDGYVYKPYQVFGHTPHHTCTEVQQNVWCIDTFSQYPDGSHFGDCTVLEITDGQKFDKIKL